jgi:apolipoprotein N-acyltransferase
MDRLANAVILSWGWRRRGFAFGAGAISALAQPPFFAFPLLWLTFPVLVWLIDGAVAQARSGRVKRLLPAFSAGWWFGFGYFLAGLWWIGAAFLVEADEFGWLMPLAVIAIPAGLALFWAVGVAAAQLLWSEDWRRVFALAAGLGAAEWLRGTVLSGFPWNSLGYALTAGEIFMQSAALFGLHALNVLAVVIFAAPAALAPASGVNGRNLILPSLAFAAMGALGLYGFIHLSRSESEFVPDTTIRIVQPALDQLQKWDPENKDEVFQSYIDLSAPEGAPLTPGTVLFWPESSFPYALTEEPSALAGIGELLPEGTVLVTGAYRAEYLPSGERRVFNSIYVIGDDGTILDAYDKVHLVPFGEYLPLPEIFGLSALRQFARGGFTPGDRRRALSIPGRPPFSPLICYEAIFPGQVLPEGLRPGFLVNVTNDGWFGRTIGPHQHFHQARVRAVEEGLPLVRAANTGISAIIDGNGRMMAGTRLGESTMIEARLPAALDTALYARWREMTTILSLAVCLFVVILRKLYRVAPV